MKRLSDVRVVIVNNFPGPGLGGGEVQLLPVVEGFIAEGAVVDVLAVPGSAFAQRCRELGARTGEVPMGQLQAASAVAAIRRKLVESDGVSGPAAVVMGTGFLTNLLVRQAARGTGAVVVNQVAVVPGASQVDGGSRAGSALRRAFDRLTAARVDRYVAVSQAVADGLALSGAAMDRVDIITNGVDPARLEAAATPDVPGLPEERVVSCIARLEPVKGVEFFVRAAAFVDDARFVVAGTGSEESRLREIATAAAGGSPVSFLGAIPSSAALMARSAVVVVPSLSEAFGLVAAEAMALSKPVVASSVGGLPEVVEDGVTGILVPPKDPIALAEAIGGLLGDPDRASAMGEAGRARACELFSADRMVREYVDLAARLTDPAQNRR